MYAYVYSCVELAMQVAFYLGIILLKSTGSCSYHTARSYFPLFFPFYVEYANDRHQRRHGTMQSYTLCHMISRIGNAIRLGINYIDTVLIWVFTRTRRPLLNFL